MNCKFKALNVGLVAALIASGAAIAAETNAPAPKASTKPSDKIAELFGDSVVAKGTGVEIKRSELDSATMGLKASGAARGQQMTPEQSTLLERQVLDRLIQIQLLLAKATEADKAKGKEDADKRYDTIMKRAGTEEALTRQLMSVGMSIEELRRKMTEEAVAEAVVVRELKVEVTDADAKKYYEDFPARFEQPEKVRASHILIGTLDPQTRSPISDEQKLAKRKIAEGILKRVKAGEDFAKLAKENSEDPGSRDNGGEYTFPRGQMVREFEDAAFSLKTNEVSEIVTTQFGFHIIKLSEKIPAKKITLEEKLDGVVVMEQVKDILRRQKLDKLLPDYVEKLTKDAKVEIMDEKLKQVGEMMKEFNKAQPPAAAEKPAAKKTDEKK
jgi:peptidyl-prolyl cis-trans isomerase C